MTITFPREMPLVGVSQQMFELQRVDYLSPDARGRIGGITAGFPLWRAEWTLGKLGPALSDEWRAWMASLRGQQRMFYGYEVGRRLPRTYLNGFPGGFTGPLSGWTQTIGTDGTATLALTGMTAGFVLLAGDYIGFQWGSGNLTKAMVRCIEGATANGSGNIAAIAIEPAVPSVVPGGATAYLNNPVCFMRMISSESAPGIIGRRGGLDGGKIVAIQDLRA